MSAPRSGDPAAASRLLGLLAEPDRLRVAAALILGAETPAAIRASTGLDARAVATAVARLSAGGLVIDHDGSLLLDEPQLKAAAASAASPRDIDDHGAIDQGAASVLRTFLRDGRLAPSPLPMPSGGWSSTTSPGPSRSGGVTPSPRSTPCCGSSTPITPRCAATWSTRNSSTAQVGSIGAQAVRSRSDGR